MRALRNYNLDVPWILVTSGGITNLLELRRIEVEEVVLLSEDPLDGSCDVHDECGGLAAAAAEETINLLNELELLASSETHSRSSQAQGIAASKLARFVADSPYVSLSRGESMLHILDCDGHILFTQELHPWARDMLGRELGAQST